MLTKEQFDKWVAALRSGEYEQGKHRLKKEKLSGGYKYCCLGVLNAVCSLGADPTESSHYPLPTLALSTSMQHDLTYMNDQDPNADFNRIARKLRTKKWREFFLGEGK